ncbi:MAG: DUF2199 domain-containing protein [Cyanobacteria bacterium HKST-UBA02]|nr:DUF2199 domain-containing protein [Cyanobacteria bacterium HKST-UBA02]
MQTRHEDLPDIGSGWPAHYEDIPESERQERAILTSDTCIIEGRDHFIRGVIEIRVHDYPESFGFGAWVSLKKENFDNYLEHPDSAEIGPYFGWLCTHIGYYKPETLGLKTMVHFKGNNERPSIELEPTDHPLAIHQKQGLTLEKAWEIVHFYL